MGFHQGSGKQQQHGASPWQREAEDGDFFSLSLDPGSTEGIKAKVIWPAGTSWEVLPELAIKHLDVNMQIKIKI